MRSLSPDSAKLERLYPFAWPLSWPWRLICMAAIIGVLICPKNDFIFSPIYFNSSWREFILSRFFTSLVSDKKDIWSTNTAASSGVASLYLRMVSIIESASSSLYWIFIRCHMFCINSFSLFRNSPLTFSLICLGSWPLW